MIRGFTIVFLCSLWAMGCTNPLEEPKAPFPQVPAHLPPVPFPADNPITPEKVELGRHLFYEKRLSPDGTVACASCHAQATAFTDAPKQVSSGINGSQGQRNAPTVVNVAYRKEMFWDGRAATMEDQAMAAFLNPIEMAADTVKVKALLKSAEYMEMWRRAFKDTAVTMYRAMQAISSFERTIISGNSRYDRYLNGQFNALSDVEREGMQLFFSNKTMCGACHGGPDLTDDMYHSVGLFHHYFDRGRYEVTKSPYDEGRFKTPTLRNVALTAPYMATGDNEKELLLTLESVVEHYDKGGTTFTNKDKRVKKLNLTTREKAALVAFMKALTDSALITNPRFGPP